MIDTQDNILDEEIKTWFDFGNSLKNREGEIFFKMLEECQIYEAGAESKGKLYSTESLIMGIILNQQRMIKYLMNAYHLDNQSTNHLINDYTSSQQQML